MVNAGPLRLGAWCILFPEMLIERFPTCLEQPFRLFPLGLCPVENIVPNKVHRQQRFTPAIERLENNLRVVSIFKLDNHQLELDQTGIGKRLQSRSSSRIILGLRSEQARNVIVALDRKSTLLNY